MGTIMSLCDRCHKRETELVQTDVVAYDFEESKTIMRIGELCKRCRHELIETIRAWARNGTKYNLTRIK